MSAFFTPAVYQQFVQRLERLPATAQPQWGKMNVAEMLAHCANALDVPTSRKKLPRLFMGRLFGKMAKKKLTADRPWDQNLPTDPHFITLGTNPEFAAAKTRLLGLMKTFHEGGAQGLNPNAHPFFGKMTADEWSRLVANHLDHHLRQFGG